MLHDHAPDRDGPIVYGLIVTGEEPPGSVHAARAVGLVAGVGRDIVGIACATGIVRVLRLIVGVGRVTRLVVRIGRVLRLIVRIGRVLGKLVGIGGVRNLIVGVGAFVGRSCHPVVAGVDDLREVLGHGSGEVRGLEARVQPGEDALKGNVVAGREAQKSPMGGHGCVEDGVKLEVGGQLGARPVEGILVVDRGDSLGFQRHRRQHGLRVRRRRRPDVVAVAAGVIGPDHAVAPQQGGPLQTLQAVLHPQDQAIVQVPRRLHGEQLDLIAAGDVVLVRKRQANPIGNQFWRHHIGRPRGRKQLLAQLGDDINGKGLLDHVDNLEAKRLMAAVAPGVAEKFNKGPPFGIPHVKMVVLFVVEEGLAVAQRVETVRGLPRRRIVVGHRLGKKAVVNDPHAATDARLVDLDRPASVLEDALGPVDRARRLDGRARDIIAHGVEQVPVAAINAETFRAVAVGVGRQRHAGRIGRGLLPGDGQRPGLRGIDLSRIRTPVVPGIYVEVGGIRFGRPVRFGSNALWQRPVALIGWRRGHNAAEEAAGHPGHIGRADQHTALDDDLAAALRHGQFHGLRNGEGEGRAAVDARVVADGHPVGALQAQTAAEGEQTRELARRDGIPRARLVGVRKAAVGTGQVRGHRDAAQRAEVVDRVIGYKLQRHVDTCARLAREPGCAQQQGKNSPAAESAANQTGMCSLWGVFHGPLWESHRRTGFSRKAL